MAKRDERSLPSGTVTFLFSDIEGSSTHWETARDAMETDLVRHDDILQRAISSNRGHVVKKTGDGFMAAFADPAAAVGAALDAQRWLANESWEVSQGDLAVRIGINTGQSEPRNGDYLGPAVNRAARLEDAGHAGQILISATTHALVSADLPGESVVTDLGEHPLRGLSKPEHIFQVTGPGLRGQFPPLRTATTPSNLPADLSAIVGRESEQETVATLVTDHRIATITGTAGLGKTTVAVAVARQLTTSFPGGVWFIDLGPINDGDLILPAVGEVLGVEPPATRPLIDALTEALRDSPTLFIFDNCEHLIDRTAAVVAELVSRTTRVHVLATSREQLRVAGEASWDLPSLGTPPPEADIDIVRQSEAVVLFSARASEIDPSFRLDESNAQAIAELSRHLDGMPLAIELAAARTRTLSPSELGDRLGSRFDLLTTGDRSSPERHQTLRSAIQWSYDLLSSEEQEFFDQLGVMVGPFDIDSAAAVTATEDHRAIDLIDTLVSQSLLRTEQGPEGTRRFRLLESLRAFAIERLTLEGRIAEAHNAHLTWAADFAESNGTEFLGPSQREAIQRVNDDVDDMRNAMAWSIESGSIEDGLRIVGALARFWYLTARQLEGASWFDRLMPLAGSADELVVARARVGAATSLMRIGRIDEAIEHVRRALESYERFDDPIGEAWARYYLGFTSWGRETLDTIDTYFVQAQELFAKAGFLPGLGFVALLQAIVAIERDPAAGLQHAENVAEMMEAAQVPNGIAHARESAGWANIAIGDLDAAKAAYARAIEAFESIPNDHCLANHCLEGCAHIAFQAGQLRDAAELWGAIEKWRENISVVPMPVERSLGQTEELLHASMGPEALEAARAVGREFDREQTLATARAIIAT